MLECRHEAHLRRACLRALDGARDEIVELDVLEAQLALLAARELDEIRDEAASARRARRTPRRVRAAPRRPAACPRGARSTFVRTAVSGVRSSCDASATRRRCAPTEPSSAASIALKRAASRPSSSLPPTATRSVRSPVAATLSAAAVRRRTGRSAAVATSAASAAATRDADPADQEDPEADAVQRVLGRRERLDRRWRLRRAGAEGATELAHP